MRQVQKRASLDERTVQKVARGETKKPRKKPVRKGRMATDTYSIKVDPLVWAEAQSRLRNAKKHGYTKIEIVSDTEVVIR